MRILRTDEARFAGLPDYPFQANYLDVASGLRMHYVDEGPRSAIPVLMMHGESSWSFLYRHMIPRVAGAGHRVLAPDLIGFGKSDKPSAVSDYSYERHITWLSTWLESLNLQNITLVCQNWSSLLGLRLVAEHPQRFARIVIGNGMPLNGEIRLPTTFAFWKAFAAYSPWFPVARMVQLGTERTLSHQELNAYEAPFPSAEYKAGARAFPRMVPGSRDSHYNRACAAAWQSLHSWNKPFITCYSNGDPLTRGGDRYYQRSIPGALGQPHITLRGGHFLQEDSPEDFARVITDALKSAMAA